MSAVAAASEPADTETTTKTGSAPAEGSAGAASALAFVGGVVAALGGFLLTIVVTRGLGVTHAGIFFVSVGLFTIIANTVELGADTGLVRAIPRLQALGRNGDLTRTLVVATVPVVVAGVASAVAVGVWAPTLARVFMEQGSTTLGTDFLRTLAPYLALAPIATVLIAGTRGFGSVAPLVVVQNVVVPLVRPLAVVLLVVFGAATDRTVAHAWGAPWAIAATAGLLIVLRQLYRARPSPRVPLSGPWRAMTREFWSFASARAFSATAEILLVWLDVLLVGWLIGPRQAGIYGAASRFITSGTLVMQATRIAIAPRVSRALTTGRPRDAERLHQRAALAVVASSWPLYLGLAFFAPLVMRLLGHGFGSGRTALVILAVAMLYRLATGNVQVVLLMGGKSTWSIANMFGALAVNVVMNLILIPRIGINGAAIAWAASIFVDNTASVLEIRYLLGIHTLNRSIVEAALASAVAFGLIAAIVLPLFGPSVPALVAWLAVGSTAFLGWFWRRRRALDLLSMFDGLPMPRAGRALLARAR